MRPALPNSLRLAAPAVVVAVAHDVVAAAVDDAFAVATIADASEATEEEDDRAEEDEAECSDTISNRAVEVDAGNVEDEKAVKSDLRAVVA